MLRTILGKGREVLARDCSSSSTLSTDTHSILEDDLEPYVDWIRRVTQEAEAARDVAGVPDW
eukprot:8246739-Karenia_brevis.AAC.1